VELVARHPALPVVVDHAALPDIADGEWATWSQRMATLAASSRVRCKLTGLVTQAGPGWTIDVLRRYVDVLAERFGPARLMWGSDWPLLTAAATYPSWYAATVALTAAWSAEDRAALMGNTARRFYGL
jgi:L-fuconolactonase